MNESSISCCSLELIQHCLTSLCGRTLDAFPNPFQNKNEINLLPLFSGGSPIKGGTVGTTIRARHPDSLCYSRQQHRLIGLQHPQAVSFKLRPSDSPPQNVPCDLICPLFVPPAPPALSAHLPVSHRCGLDCGSRECRWMNMSRNRNGVKPEG